MALPMAGSVVQDSGRELANSLGDSSRLQIEPKPHQIIEPMKSQVSQQLPQAIMHLSGLPHVEQNDFIANHGFKRSNTTNYGLKSQAAIREHGAASV